MWTVLLHYLTETLTALVSPAQRFFWLFLFANVLIALGLTFWRLPKEVSDRAAKSLELAFPKEVYKHRSALLDYRYAAINAFVSILIQAATGVGTIVLMQQSKGALDAVFGAAAKPLDASFLTCLAFTFGLVFLFDAANFFAHYLQHKIPALWEFHKVHHSAEVLTPITVLRMHPIDDLITAGTHIVAFGLANGLFLHFHGGTVTTLTVLGANVFYFLYYIFGYHLRHSHVWVMFPKGLREIFSSPALHLVHHSKAEQHWDKNFAPVFTLWDWLFGTLYQPKQYEEIEFGIADEDSCELRSIRQLYLTPFKKALAMATVGFGRLARQGGPN